MSELNRSRGGWPSVWRADLDCRVICGVGCCREEGDIKCVGAPAGPAAVHPDFQGHHLGLCRLVPWGSPQHKRVYPSAFDRSESSTLMAYRNATTKPF